MIKTSVEMGQQPITISLFGDEWVVVLLVSRTKDVEKLIEQDEPHREMRYPTYSISEECVSVFDRLYKNLMDYPSFVDGSMDSYERQLLVRDKVLLVPNGEFTEEVGSVIKAITECLLSVRCVRRSKEVYV